MNEQNEWSSDVDSKADGDDLLKQVSFEDVQEEKTVVDTSLAVSSSITNNE